MAANIFTGITSANWGTATNWSLGAVPTASDGNVATFDILSPNCTVDASNKVCNGINFTGYTNTIAFGIRTITVSGNVTFGAAMLVTGTGTLAMNATGSLTTNTYTWPIVFQFMGTSQTYTLQDDFNISGALGLNGTTNVTVNNNGTAKTIYAGQNVTSSTAGSLGTALIVMNGTGLLSNTGTIRNSLEINTAGTITFGLNVRVTNFKYTAGTIDDTTFSAIIFVGFAAATSNLDIGSREWINVNFVGSTTITLISDVTTTGLMTCAGNCVINGAFSLNVKGSFTAGGGGTLTGTVTALNFVGAAPIWATGSGSVRVNTNINSTGTFTATGTNGFGTGILKWIAGTVDASAGTLTFLTSTTLDLNGASAVWGNCLMITTNTTVTLNSAWHLTNIVVGTCTFTGNFGFTIANFSCTIVGRTINFKSTNTYNITTSLVLTGSQVSPILFKAVTSSSDAFVILSSGAACYVSFVNATDIDSSAGRVVHDVKGVLLRTTNWYITNPDAFPFF